MVREDAGYDFNFLKFTEVWFVTQDVVYPGECSMCTWKEGLFFVKLVWWYWILLTFACLKSFLLLHQFWMRSLPCTVILVIDFFLSNTLNISCHSFLAFKVSAERPAVKHMGFPLYVMCCFSLAAFNILFVFSLC